MNGTFNSPSKALAMVCLTTSRRAYKSTPLGGSTPVENIFLDVNWGSNDLTSGS